MRSLGELDQEEKASVFAGYLNGISIRAEIEEDAPGGPWTIWVHDEEKLEQARSEITLFRQSPTDPKYQKIAREGEVRAQATTRKEKKLRRKEEQLARRWRFDFRKIKSQTGRFTLSLIVISVIAYLLSHLSEAFIRLLLISGIKKEYEFLPEVLHGQLWRLVTPIFLHSLSSPLHIIFNMYWLFELGRMIESRRGGRFLLFFVLILAVSSNLCQYMLSGPEFGGMSGVVYGLFGYIWMKGKFDPEDGLMLHPTTIMVMLFWFVFCFFGSLNIANGAHAGGLAVGTLWGYLSSKLRSRR